MKATVAALILLVLAGMAVAQKMKAQPAAATDKTEGTGEVTVRLLLPDGGTGEPVTVKKVVKSDREWRAQLTAEQYRITRDASTESAFCGVFYDNHKVGVYSCIGCGLPLFRSEAKFDSGTGWPSFFKPFAPENIGTKRDESHKMVRKEIHCIRCDSHLGHLFDDGPAPTHARYCLNSASLSFQEADPAGTAPAGDDKKPEAARVP